MRKSAIAFVGVGAVLLALAMIGWMWIGRHHPTASKSPPGRGSATVTASHGIPAATAEPAHALVTVRDDKGPIAGAMVRLAHEGDVTIVQTGANGTARVDDLEAGDWDISASADGHVPGAAKTKALRAGETTKLDHHARHRR